MNIKVKKFQNGIPMLKITFTTRAQRRKALLNNDIVIELMTMAFHEGQRFGNLQDLISNLKR